MKFEGNFNFARVFGLSMLVMMPYSGTSLAQMQENLNRASLESIKDKYSQVKVMVYLPKFKTEFELELTDTLKKVTLIRGIRNI